MISRLIAYIEAALRVTAALCIAILTVLVVFQVIVRYGGGSVPLFAEEIARYGMIWMVLLATAVSVREASHIRIDFVPIILHHFSPRASLVLDALLDVISLTAFLILIWYGVDMMMFAAGQTSVGLRVPLSYPYAVVPFSFLCASIFAIARLRERIPQI